MKDIFDPKALGAESKLDLGILFFAAGLGGILDAVFNIAGFVEPLTFAAICGPTVLGIKHIVVGVRDKAGGGSSG